jgi:type II secretory pathway component PulL
MSRQILAIDIRQETLAAVLLNTGLKINTVASCIHLPINGNAETDEPLTEALAQLMTELNIGSVNTVVSLPADETLFRILTVPFKDEGKIKQVLPFELEPIVPVPVDNLVIGFQKALIDEQTEVLATAIERDRYEHYQQSLSATGMKPQLIVPGSFAVVSQIIANSDPLPEQTLILDVDQTRTTLYAIVSGRIALVRSLIGGARSEAEAESLALQIRQTLTAFEDVKSIDFSPAVVYLCGPGTRESSTMEHMAKSLDLPTHQLNLREHIAKVEFATIDTYTPWQMDNALALALLEAEGLDCPNFHRTSSPLRNYWAAYRPFVKTPAILLIMALILGLGGVFYDNLLLQKRVNSIHDRMEQVFTSAFPGERLAKGAALAQMKSKLKEAQKSAAAPIQGAARMRTIDTLLQISQLLPSSIDVIVDRFVVGDDSVTLSGETSGFNIVDDIKGRLEKSDVFHEVTIASANMDKAGKKVRFKLKIEYEKN